MAEDIKKQISDLSKTLNTLAESRSVAQAARLAQRMEELLKTMQEESLDDASWENNFVFVENRLEYLTAGMRRPISTLPGQPRGGGGTSSSSSSGGTTSSSVPAKKIATQCPDCGQSLTISHP